MLEYLISAANIIGLAMCVYIAYFVLISARSTHSGVRQNRVKVIRDSAASEHYFRSEEPGCYYVM